MKLARLAALIGVLSAASPASALDPAKALTQYARDSWSVEEGLPQSSALSLLQSRDGYVWIASEEGLVRFDGVAFTQYDARLVPALTRPFTYMVAQDTEGVVWGGTVGGELLRVRGGVGDVAARLDADAGQATALTAGRSGGLWVGSDKGTVYRYSANRLEKVASADAEVLALGEQADGTLWIGTGTRLLRRRGTVVEPMGKAHGFPEGGVGSIDTAADGTLRIGFLGVVCTLRGPDPSCMGAAEGVPNDSVEASLVDRDGNLWLALSRSGVVRLRDGKASPFGEKEGLPTTSVRALLEDREGGIWIGMQGGGIVRLRDGAVTPLGTPEGLCADILWSITEDNAGSLWVGTHGAGLCRLDQNGSRQFRVAQGLPSDFVFAVTPARDGGVWAAAGRAVAHVKGETVTLEKFGGAELATVIALFEDSHGRLFAGTLGTGVALRERGVSRTLRQKDGLPSDFVNGFLEDRAGGIWILTREGIVRYHDGRLETPIRKEQGIVGGAVTSMVEEPDGTLWIATDAGVTRRKGGRLTSYDTKKGLYHNSLLRMLDDGRGHLWFSSSKGVFRVAKSDFDDIDAGRRALLTPVVFNRADGMRHPECNGGSQAAGHQMRDGRMMFPTMKGIAIVDPARLPRNEVAPLLAVQSIGAGGKPEAPADPLELSPERRSVEINYAGLSFNAPTKLRFRYRLEGFDTDWVDAGTRRTAFYTGLKPGNYTFRVSAANEHGVWNEAGASTRLRLKPRFRETTPFFLLCAAALALVGFAGIRLRGRRMRAQALELERLVELRTDQLQLSKAELEHSNEELQRILEELQGAQAQIVQSEKMASLGQMVAGVAHEINNPINFISGASENLRIKTAEFRSFLAELMGEEAESEVGREVSSQLDELGKMIQTIRNGTERVKKIVLSLRSFSRLDEADFKEVDLHEGIESTLEILMFKFKDRIRLVRDYGEIPLVECNASQINQVVMNLIVNASQAIEGDGAITIRTAMDGAGFVHLDVSDTGSGIPADKLEKVFDPFYTTKKVGEGTGLGLSISYGIVKEHGGEIRVTSVVGEGTTFRIRLPVTAARPAAKP